MNWINDFKFLLQHIEKEIKNNNVLFICGENEIIREKENCIYKIYDEKIYLSDDKIIPFPSGKLYLVIVSKILYKQLLKEIKLKISKKIDCLDEVDLDLDLLGNH